MIAGRQCTQPNMGSIELDRHFARFQSGIRFAIEQFEDRNIPSELDDATVRGIIARACYTVGHEKLRLFCMLYGTGYGQHPVISTFREWMFSLRDRRESTRREIYKRCERTLHAFIEDKKEVESSEPFLELYPLSHIRQ